MKREFEEYELKHIEMLRPFLSECTVLLKNERDFRVNSPGNVALFGNGGRRTFKGGTGSGEVNSKYFVTVEEGLENAGFTVTTKAWFDCYELIREEAKADFIKQLKSEARKAHVNYFVYSMGMVMNEPEYDIPLAGDGELCIYVLSRICGEGNDRKAVPGDLLLTKSEIRDILTLNDKFEKFLLVLNVGGPVDLSPVMSVPNILVLSQLGVDTGSVIADLVLSKAYPSGKLTTTWSAAGDYCDLGDFGKPEDTMYKEGVYVGYRYFDTVGKKAMFPFGFGLGFTKFEMRTLSSELEGTVLTIKTLVKNIGIERGKEVCQLYVSLPEGALKQPLKQLVDFRKTKELISSEEETLEFSVDLKDLASFDEERASYVLEKGRYVFMIGPDSVNTQYSCVVGLSQTVEVTKVKNALGPIVITDEVLERPAIKVPENIKVLMADPSAFETKIIDYDKEFQIEDEVKELTDDQLISLSVGAHDPDAGIAAIIGEASKSVAGAAGETSAAAVPSGIRTLVMADGPAGLRLSPDFYRDAKGVHSLGNPLMAGILDTMGPFLKWAVKTFLTKKPKKGFETLHQWCTAIPIGTAIAQSFNLDFARTCGDIVGDEMERMNVDLWLAPALNIHRSILCGRNFEYYSEDPVVSGKFAAALTKGVQSHKGRGVTIKHFAANNQETNRYNSNSHVSERAMRDIYLKGFEICVKESQPKAVMTSYNLLNGTHTSERHDLNEDILRCEWGFDGLVMTDWVVSMTEGKITPKYPAPEAYKVALSGNDLFMPGSAKEIENLTEAFQDRKISRERLEINVSRLVRLTKM